MHNVKRFLEDSAYVFCIHLLPFYSFLIQNPKMQLRTCSFEPSQEARATAKGNLKPDDLIAIYRKRTRGRETVTWLTYFVWRRYPSLARVV